MTTSLALLAVAIVLAPGAVAPGGQPRPLRGANGYVHVQDTAGCEWWARDLGPDPSQWVVRP